MSSYFDLNKRIADPGGFYPDPTVENRKPGPNPAFEKKPDATFEEKTG